MCFTISQIERACGLLLLDEFNGFVYYCKKCSCDFDSGPNLEVHILSEHQDDKETIFVNDDISVDYTEPTIIESELTDIKDEQFGENFEQSSELIVEESKIEEQIVNTLPESLKEESSDEDDTPLAELFESHELNDESSNDESTKEKNEVKVVKKRRGRPIGWKKRRNSDNDESFTLEKSITNKPPESKKKKINESTEKSNKESTESNIKRSVGRPAGSKNKFYDAVNSYAIDNVDALNKKSGRPTIGILYCDMCPGLAFDGKMNLKKHMYRHIAQKRLCEICNKIPRKGYKRHMEKFHTVQQIESTEQVQCDICNTKFKSKTNLTLHMRTHTGEKPYLCAQCGKSYHTTASYHSHVSIVHGNSRKYKCNLCDRAFHRNCILRDHMNAFHTMERPHLCDICGKGFASKSYLRIHKMTHGEAMLSCRYCEKKFKLAENRHKHELSIHKIAKTDGGSYKHSWSISEAKNAQLELDKKG